MNPIKPTVPPNAEVSSYLYPKMDIDDLTQDLMTVALPNGFFVDVGWYPEHDPNGQFIVRVFWQYWNHQMLDTPFATPHIAEMLVAVEQLAERFSRGLVPTSRSGVESRQNPFILTH